MDNTKMFFETLFPDLNNEFIEIRLLQNQGNAQSLFLDKIPDNMEELPDYKTCNAFFGVCPRGQKSGGKDAISRLWTLWVDLDTKDSPAGKRGLIERIKMFKLKPTVLIDSGNGYHAYWRLDDPFVINEPEDINRIEPYLKALSTNLKADPHAAELARILRIPGTLNNKNPEKPLTVDLISINPEKIYRLSDFNFLVESMPVNSQLFKNSPGWVSNTLENLAEGNRNASFAKIIGRLHRGQWSEQEIYSLLSLHAKDSGFPESEFKNEIEGICKRYPFQSPSTNSKETENEKKILKFRTLSELLADDITEIPWLVENIFPQEGVGIVGGTAGIGKSWMLKDLAVECARGGLWLNHFQTLPCTVLYIDEESSNALLNKRFKQLLSAKEISIENLNIHFGVGQGFCLTESDYIAGLRSKIEQVKPGIVIIDSLIRVHKVDENSAREMAQVFDVVKGIVREYKCAFVFADHQRKPGIHSSSQEFMLRGTSEKIAFVDTLLSLKKQNNTLIVEHSKSRYCEPVEPFTICLEDQEKGKTRIFYSGTAEDIKKTSHSDLIRSFLNEVLPLNDWVKRQDLVTKAKDHDISEKALDAGLKLLEESQEIKRENRKTATGQGGKSAFYCWNEKTNQSPVSFPTEETETE